MRSRKMQSIVKFVERNSDARELEPILHALHASCNLSPKALRILYYVLNSCRAEELHGGSWNRVREAIQKIKFELATMIYF